MERMARSGFETSTSRHAGLFAVLVLLGAGSLLAGMACGGGSGSPAGSANDAVLRFLDDLQARHFAAACARVTPEVASEIRHAVLAELRVPVGTASSRLAFIRRANTSTRRCSVAVAWRTRQVRTLLPRLRTAALETKATRLGTTDWVIDPSGQMWVVSERGDRWVISAANAFVTRE